MGTDTETLTLTLTQRLAQGGDNERDQVHRPEFARIHEARDSEHHPRDHEHHPHGPGTKEIFWGTQTGAVHQVQLKWGHNGAFHRRTKERSYQGKRVENKIWRFGGDRWRHPGTNLPRGVHREL